MGPKFRTFSSLDPISLLTSDQRAAGGERATPRRPTARERARQGGELSALGEREGARGVPASTVRGRSVGICPRPTIARSVE